MENFEKHNPSNVKRHQVFLPNHPIHRWLLKLFIPILSLVLSYLFYIITISASSIRNNSTSNEIEPIFFGKKTSLYGQISKAVGSSINIKVETNTEGSLDILEKVSQTPNSFGLCQADVFESQKLKSVNVIDTLFNDYLQILYPGTHKGGLKLTSSKDGQIDSIFTTSKLYIDTRLSGTFYTATLFLNTLKKEHNIEIQETQKIYKRGVGADMDSSLLFFVSNKLDDNFNSLIQDKKSYVLDIDKSFSEKMVGYTSMPFNYNNSEKVSTISTPALLICNRETEHKYINEIIKFFNTNKIGKEAVNNKEIKNNIKKEFTYKNYERSMFFLIMFAYFLFFYFALRNLISNMQRIYLFGILNQVVKRNLEPVVSIGRNETNYILTPNLSRNNHRDVINKATTGLRELFILRNQIGDFHNKSLLSRKNYDFLMGGSDSIIVKLRKIIAFRFNELIEGDEILVEKSTLRQFLTAEFIEKTHYDWLINKWRENAIELSSGAYLLKLVTDKDQIAEAIDRILSTLENYAEHENIQDELNRIRLISGRYRANEKLRLQEEVIDNNDYRIEVNKIRKALVEFINEAVKLKIIPG